LARKGIDGYYRPPTQADLRHIADNLRQADIAELIATHGYDCDPYDIILESVRMTPNAEVRIVNATGEPIAVRGCTPYPLLGGIPWLLATDKAFDFPAMFLIEGRQFFRENTGEFGTLVNYVDARNTKSIRWLAKIGFVIHEAEPFGKLGLPFHRFTGTRNTSVQQ
jgi:hypothetical protein